MNLLSRLYNLAFGIPVPQPAPVPVPQIVVCAPPEPAPGSAPEPDRFWIVWSPDHPASPRVIHGKKRIAELVAKKMLRSRKCRNATLYVMQATSVWQHNGERPKGRHY